MEYRQSGKTEIFGISTVGSNPTIPKMWESVLNFLKVKKQKPHLYTWIFFGGFVLGCLFAAVLICWIIWAYAPFRVVTEILWWFHFGNTDNIPTEDEFRAWRRRMEWLKKIGKK